MFNVRLAGGHLYGKQLFTWLSLVVSLMASFVLSFFPLDVLDELWDVTESVSEGFLTYSCYLSLGSESCLNLPNIALYSPTMFISTTQFVTCHVNSMQHMKLTPSDVQEMSQ